MDDVEESKIEEVQAEAPEENREDYDKVREEVNAAIRGEMDEPEVSEVVAEEAPEESNQEEELAKAKGWVPPEEYEGDATPIDAGEFLRKEPLLAKNAENQRRIRALEGTVKQLIDHNKGLADAQRQKRLQEIERQKLESVDLADQEAYQQAIQAEKELWSEPTIDQALSQAQEVPQFTGDEQKVFTDFKNKHEAVWLNESSDENKRMFQRAEKVYEWASTEHPNWDVKSILSEVERDLAFSYPHRFASSKAPVSAVESNRSRGARSGKGKITFNDLDGMQKKFCKEFVDQGIMSESEYLQQIEDARKTTRIESWHVR